MSRPKLPIQSTLYRGLLETLKTLLLIVGLYTLVNLALPRYMVEGRSMQPLFNGEGSERVMVNRVDYYLQSPQRGDVVVMINPNNAEEYYIKRIIGLPHETVTMDEGQVKVNGVLLNESYIPTLCQNTRCTDREWILGADEFVVLGDNRNASHDSTAFGAIPRSLIVGRAWLHYWPPDEWKIFRHHEYE